jgi:hypothetical protein
MPIRTARFSRPRRVLGQVQRRVDLPHEEAVACQECTLNGYVRREVVRSEEERGKLAEFWNPHRVPRGLTREQVTVCLALLPLMKMCSATLPIKGWVPWMSEAGFEAIIASAHRLIQEQMFPRQKVDLLRNLSSGSQFMFLQSHDNTESRCESIYVKSDNGIGAAVRLHDGRLVHLLPDREVVRVR